MPPLTLEQGLSRLRAEVEEAFHQWEHRPDSVQHRLVALKSELPRRCACVWLKHQASRHAVLWRSKHDSRMAVGIGVADRIQGASPDPETVLRRVRKYLAGADRDTRYYGGFAFGPDSWDDPLWQEFGPAQFVLPRIELRTSPDGSELRVNLLFREDVPLSLPEILENLDRLDWQEGVSLDPLPAIVRRQDVPDQSHWEAAVSSALDLISENLMDKVVLARRASFEFADDLPPERVMCRLVQVTSDCFHFLFRFGETSTFMGTTPERLFLRNGSDIQTEVLAGTRARGGDAAEDERLANDLLSAVKDRWEHEIVRRFMRRRLHLCCTGMRMDPEPHVLKLERKQHLRSGITASLKPGVTDGEILRHLHPTPAVGGDPSDVALKEIPRLETFRRGWYAAPVGWVTGDACEFAVAIRSGLMEQRTMHVYSGAGIVEGSVPAEEWAEIEQKISDFRRITQPA